MLQGRDDHCGLACKLRPRWRSTDHDHAPIERRWNEIERKFPVYVCRSSPRAIARSRIAIPCARLASAILVLSRRMSPERAASA